MTTTTAEPERKPRQEALTSRALWPISLDAFLSIGNHRESAPPALHLLPTDWAIPKLRNPLSLDAFNNMYGYRESSSLTKASGTGKDLPVNVNPGIRSGNFGIRNLEVVVQDLQERLPTSIAHRTPIVLVPGFSGWGQPLLGGRYSNFPETLASEGYAVIEPRLGPVSSNRERACELFQQLTNINIDANGRGTGFDKPGTTSTFIGVNYGSLPLHPSEQINQPSKTYQAVVRGEANFPASWTWSTTNKVTFICHSHGGTTVRYLLYLLSGAAPPDLPQFPTEDEQDRAKAVITLGTPHQGSTITSLIQQYFLQADPDCNAIVDLITACSFAPREARVYDLGLDHWGFTRFGLEDYLAMRLRITPAVVAWFKGQHHGLYDNSILGATTLNGLTANVPRPPIYFFSMAFCATIPFPNRLLEYRDINEFICLFPLGNIFALGIGTILRFARWIGFVPSLQNVFSWFTNVANRHLDALGYFLRIPHPGKQIPRPDMLPVLAPFAYGMAGITAGAWVANDGIVNTVSMDGPPGNGNVHPAQEFVSRLDPTNLKRVQGRFWYFGENSTIDHADQLGIFTDPTTNAEVEVMYKLFAKLADRLP